MSSKTSIPALRRAESYTNSSNNSSPKASPRILAAPFQVKDEQEGVSTSPSKLSGLESAQYNFVPLEDYSNVTFDKVLTYHVLKRRYRHVNVRCCSIVDQLLKAIG